MVMPRIGGPLGAMVMIQCQVMFRHATQVLIVSITTDGCVAWSASTAVRFASVGPPSGRPATMLKLSLISWYVGAALASKPVLNDGSSDGQFMSAPYVL